MSTNEETNSDVLILGAGPAGTSAAIQCLQAGLRVTLIEREFFPREHTGETLHPGIEPLLVRLGVDRKVQAAGFLRHEGNWVQWGDKRQFQPFGFNGTEIWRGFQAWRTDFDSILLDRARELGCVIIQPCRAVHPLVRHHRVVGVETSEGPVQATFVVDAAGSQHWLARQLGLNHTTYSPPLTARFGYVEGKCSIRDKTPAIVADQRGWTWTARVRSGLYQWTRLSFENRPLEKGWIPEEFRLLYPRGRVRGADVTWRVISEPAGPGYFTVGDATAVLDPASSHGVLKAIMAGMFVGHLITQIVRQGQKESRIKEAYCQWVSRLFEHDVQRLRQLYKELPNPPAWV